MSSAVSAQIDAQGFLWFATHDGLARFDGSEFEVYDNARYPQMGSNRISRLYRGKAGTVYALGSSGEWLRVHSGLIERIDFGSSDSPPAVRYVSSTDQQLCVTVVSGMYCEEESGFALRRSFEPSTDVMAAIPQGASDWLLQSNGEVVSADAQGRRVLWSGQPLPRLAAWPLAALVRPNGSLVVATVDGIREIDRVGDSRWLEHEPGKDFQIISLLRTNDDALLVGTPYDWYQIDAQGRTELRPSSYPIEAATRTWSGPDGALWHSQSCDLYRGDERVLSCQGEIRDLVFSPGGSAWVSTNRDGIYALSRPRIERPASAKLAASNAYGVSPSVDGSIWVGSLGDALFEVAADGAVQQYGSDDGLPGVHVRAVASGPDGSVYAANVSPGLWRRKPAAERFLSIALPEIFDRFPIRSITFDHQQRLWLGSGGGAWVRDTQGWQKRWPEQGEASVRCLLVEADGGVWYGSTLGLWRQRGGRSWPVARDLLGDVAVRGIQRTSDGSLWAASEGGGLLWLPPGDDTGTGALLLGRAEGLPSNSPHAILEDAYGDIWVNSNQGIFRITAEQAANFRAGVTETLSPLVLGQADGLEELEGNGGVQPAAAADGQGRLWFPTQRGIVSFQPQRFRAGRQPPIPVIEAIQAEGKALELSDDLQVPLGDRVVSIYYNAAHLDSDQVHFRYRLMPLQRRWVDAGSRTDTSFGALAPGTYAFELLAANNHGVWTEVPATIAFTVPSYWYETGLFRFGLLAFIIWASVALVRVRTRALRDRSLQLDQQVTARTAELSTEKARAEDTLVALGEAHAQLTDSHRGIETRNQRLAEQATRLEGLDRFRTRLLADVSHELRTPLMLVDLPLEELADDKSGLAERQIRLVALAKRQTGRLSQLVEQLVTLVQAEAQQIQLQLRRIDLAALVGEVIANFEPVAIESKIRFELSAPKTLPRVYADPAQLTTVLSNFLDNAGKYATAGSVVAVRVECLEDADSLRLSVTDTGPGFPAEIAQNLFERFFRGAGPPRAGREGLGIGLALARELIELHGGRIGADSEVNKGARFWFELPLGSAHVAPEEIDLSIDTSIVEMLEPTGSGQVLLVEDHPELASYLGERLSEHMRVQTVGDAESAWLAIESGDFGCVVSDVMLPGISGLELCERIKAGPTSAIPVVLISAKSGQVDQQAGLNAGAVCWLSKPFNLEALISAIRHAAPATLAMPKANPALGPDQTPTDDAPDSEMLLQIAHEYLADASFDVSQWSDRAFLSARQLRRRVAELTGVAPLAWLREQRLLRVRELISSGNCRTLAEAGARSGLDNASYLYRLYRARFGES